MLALAYAFLSAVAAVHIAAMGIHGIARVMSFDRGLHAYPRLERLG